MAIKSRSRTLQYIKSNVILPTTLIITPKNKINSGIP
jgi:hypothetical protein